MDVATSVDGNADHVVGTVRGIGVAELDEKRRRGGAGGAEQPQDPINDLRGDSLAMDLGAHVQAHDGLARLGEADGIVVAGGGRAAHEAGDVTNGRCDGG